MLDKIKGIGIGETSTANEFAGISANLGLPQDFDEVTPGTKVKLLARAIEDRPLVTRYLTLGDESNIIRAAKASIPSVRSGVASFLRFRHLLGRPPLHPTDDTVHLWSATFNTGKKFGQYLARLQKSCLLMAHDLSWLTPAARPFSKGLKNAQDLSSKPPNFIESKSLIRILEFAKLHSDRCQAYFLSYLFSLRAPSETLRLTRAFRGARLTELAPPHHTQGGKALMGIRSHNGADALGVKFPLRKNIRNGCILMRPRLFGLATQFPCDLCPIHKVWPLIRDRVKAGDLLFPGVTADNFNRPRRPLWPLLALARADYIHPTVFDAARPTK